MSKLITIKTIQNALLDGFSDFAYVNDETSRRMWWSALELIQKEYLPSNYLDGGLWIAAPLPAINEKKYLNKLKGWLWAPEGVPSLSHEQRKYLPHNEPNIKSNKSLFTSSYKILNLNIHDGFEPFLLIVTPKFQCVLTISGEKDKKVLIMRSDEDSLKKVINLVDKKLSQHNLEESNEFQKYLMSLGELSINNEFSNSFWPNLAIRLTRLIPTVNFQNSFQEQSNKSLQISEAKLLEAISHEVRTPLTTIKTLVSSALRRTNIDETIKNRLLQIDNECTEQIDRFGLIFTAAELVNSESSPSQNLTSINLGEILRKLSPNWISQLSRRGIEIRIDIPNDLPDVLSNSEKLELMLGGLIDKNTRGLNQGSTIILELRPAGQKLKLQLIVLRSTIDSKDNNSEYDGSDIGPVLNWNPQTGSLQISQSATQKLLASLGGRVARRRDTGITVFFPVSDIK